MLRGLLVAVIVLSATVPVTAAADSDPPDDLFGADSETVPGIGVSTESVPAFVEGLLARFDAADIPFLENESDETAADAAQNVQTAFNGNASSFQEYVNNRTSASTDYDVIALEYVIGDETATMYLVANVSDGDYQDMSIVDSTDRTADETCTFEDRAARQADAELERFHDETVVNGEAISQARVARLAGEYGGSIDCSFDF